MSAGKLFERYFANPIIRIDAMQVPCKAVCNPGAVQIGETTLLLLRVIDPLDSSHLTVARSENGRDGWQIETAPLLTPDAQGGWFETLGCEDPRITYLEDRDEYVITYVGASRLGSGICLATTRDFRRVERLGMVIHPYNKDAALFPRRIGGKYLLLHRPSSGGLEDIWLTESEDLLHWGRPRCILEKSDPPGWDSGKVGTGPPPIETPDGWLLIFHGVEPHAHGWTYRVGLALLDLDDPRKVIARTTQPVLSPEAPYEQNGLNPGVIFPTGTVQKNGELFLYYGADDTGVALATTKIETLLDALHAHG